MNQQVDLLDVFLDEIYTQADQQGISKKEMASASGVSLSTIYRHSKHQSRLPRFQTIMRMANGVGLIVDIQVPPYTRRKRRAS